MFPDYRKALVCWTWKELGQLWHVPHETAQQYLPATPERPAPPGGLAAWSSSPPGCVVPAPDSRPAPLSSPEAPRPAGRQGCGYPVAVTAGPCRAPVCPTPSPGFTWRFPATPRSWLAWPSHECAFEILCQRKHWRPRPVLGQVPELQSPWRRRTGADPCCQRPGTSFPIRYLLRPASGRGALAAGLLPSRTWRAGPTWPPAEARSFGK